jgi:putative acetyltransferase
MPKASRASSARDSSGLVVRRSDSSAPEILCLVQQLWNELGRLYPEMNGHLSPPNDIVGERSPFVLAWLNGRAAGCGAFRPIAADECEIAEIKRMYVEPGSRRRGVSRAILRELERLAREYGFSVARLETGLRQPNAIRLYETSGYHRIEPFGRYSDDSLSVCFEKVL